MADPTSQINHTFQNILNRDISYYQIKSAEALVIGGHAALNRSTGKMEFADDAANLIPMGIITTQLHGDNTNLTGNAAGDYSAVARGGIVAQVAVTGASAITDAGKFVYATDGQTYTLTSPADDSVPYGIVMRWVSSTTCDVYFFGLIEAIQMSLIPRRATICLGSFPTNALQGTAAAELLTDIPMYGHFTIDSWYAVPVAYDNAAVAGDQNLEIDIGATSVKTTGGVNPTQINITYAELDAVGTMGTAIAGSAIASANEVHDGDTISVRMAASGTGFTADCAAAFNLYIQVTYLPGA